ncbi:tetratricopeptide repeat protein [Nitriliruptor alkaliphilus]|uniref:tetratricopeptide repeat protein n=1 Tax=Nitriliruptor alkaliphilus TaxID=427918 RepID=UPI000697F606|nr:hypothetical protein [Nitriliruptor alkaliphilus]
MAADDPTTPPDGPRKAKPVPPPPPPPPAPDAEAETGDGRPPASQRRPPGRGGSSSRDAEQAPRTKPDARDGAGRGEAPGLSRGGATRREPVRGAKGSGGSGRGAPRRAPFSPQSRSSTPQTPGGNRGRPVGAEKARRRQDAPTRRPESKPAPARPDLPVGDEPNLPKAVKKDLERTLGKGRRTDEVALALSVGSQAIDELAIDLALEYLAWAKDQAPRVAPIREAYGVARYLAEDFAGALTELQAYARISGRNDQNHVIADCHRALGRDLERIEEVARPLLDDDRAPADRRAEAGIVLAAALGDAGRVEDGIGVLGAILAERRDRDHEHHLRVRSLLADLAVRAGDRDTAARHLQVLLAADDDGTFEARERLDALGDTN